METRAEAIRGFAQFDLEPRRQPGLWSMPRGWANLSMLADVRDRAG